MQPSARLFMTKSMYHHCKQQEHTNHVEGKMVFKDKLIWSKIRQEKKGRIKWAFPILEAYLVFLKKNNLETLKLTYSIFEILWMLIS